MRPVVVVQLVGGERKPQLLLLARVYGIWHMVRVALWGVTLVAASIGNNSPACAFALESNPISLNTEYPKLFLALKCLGGSGSFYIQLIPHQSLKYLGTAFIHRHCYCYVQAHCLSSDSATMDWGLLDANNGGWKMLLWSPTAWN